MRIIKSIVLFWFSVIASIAIIIHTAIYYGIEQLVFLDTKAALKEFEEEAGLTPPFAIIIGLLLWVLVINIIF